MNQNLLVVLLKMFSIILNVKYKYIFNQELKNRHVNYLKIKLSRFNLYLELYIYKFINFSKFSHQSHEWLV